MAEVDPIITTHAIEQYRNRVDPKAAEHHARNILKNIFNFSKQIGKTFDGSIRESQHYPGVRLVIKDINTVVTVLPIGWDMSDVIQYEVDLRKDAEAERKETLQMLLTEVESEIASCNQELDFFRCMKQTLSRRKEQLDRELKGLM